VNLDHAISLAYGLGSQRRERDKNGGTDET